MTQQLELPLGNEPQQLLLPFDPPLQLVSELQMLPPVMIVDDVREISRRRLEQIIIASMRANLPSIVRSQVR